MLLHKIEISDEDISYAEKILLSEGQVFDSERRAFIMNLKTIDLQAVPGSGKTTALLAKLIILERYMPFNDGAGILVISHTNTAIDEIKKKIGKYCPRLFAYPNFVGTIQSFVDQFLAIPFYTKCFKTKPYRIDNEIYNEAVSKNIYSLDQPLDQTTKKNKNHLFKSNDSTDSIFYKTRFGIADNGVRILLDGLNGKKLSDIKKPHGNTKKENYHDYSQEEKDKLIQWLYKFKAHVLKNGYLHFDDAYFLAERYIQKIPKIKEILQKRFSYVFVDEMQDMDMHQYKILEIIFYNHGNSISRYQRIGDRNQAIFSSNVKIEKIWEDRPEVKLTLNGSYRLTPQTAKVVKYFGLEYLDIKALREDYQLKPHIIVFDDPEKVLSKFTEIIKNNKLVDDKYPFCAIGWRIKHDNYLGIKNYHSPFEGRENKKIIDYSTLNDYLKFYDKEDSSLAAAYNNILRAFIKMLRLANKKDANDRNYTIRTLLSFLKEADKNSKKHEEFTLLLFEWSFNLKKEGDVLEAIKNYMPYFFSTFFSLEKFTDEMQDFINSEDIAGNENQKILAEMKECNIHKSNGIKVMIGTIHSVKGETHTATLYVESFYYGEYESERLANQIIGNKFPENAKDRCKQSAKMAYVGFSRPTHLLCFAIHKDRFAPMEKSTLNTGNWEIIYS